MSERSLSVTPENDKSIGNISGSGSGVGVGAGVGSGVGIGVGSAVGTGVGITSGSGSASLHDIRPSSIIVDIINATICVALNLISANPVFVSV